MMKPSALDLALGVLAVVLLLALAWNFDPFHRRQHAEQKAADATAQAHVADATTRATDTYHEQTIILRDRADHATQAVQKAAGADTVLPPDVRRAWSDGLRDLAPTSPDPLAGKPAG